MGSVDFKKCDGCIVVGATIFNISKFKFTNVDLLLDTGSSFTVIDLELILSFGYELENTKNGQVIHAASGDLNYKVAELSSLTTIGESISPMAIAAINLPNVLKDNGIAGLLGMDFLSQFEISISCSSNRIKIEKYARDL